MEQILYQLNDRERFIVSRWAYSVGCPLMSDAEYTTLLRMMEATLPEDEYVKRSWSSDPCPVDLLKRIGREDLIHKVILTDKTESIPSLNTSWEVKSELENINTPGTLSMKHDGWNIQANYFRGNLVLMTTRGRSCDAIDVSKLFDYIPRNIPVQNPCKTVMEMTISKKNFVICSRLYGNVSPRSAVSTILAHPESYDLLSFSAFDIHGIDLQGKCKFDVLREWGFKTPEYRKVVTYDDVLSALKELSDLEPTYEEPTDGAVYDGETRRAIRLLAWEEPIYYSYVTGYLEQFGPYRISPSVTIAPILRKGTTQRRVSMTNWQRIMDYNLAPGAPIAFRVASSATADFDEDATRLAHKQWEGRWDEYKKQIDMNEEINRYNWKLSMNM